MKNLNELFAKPNLSSCVAQTTELGYKTDRFRIESANEAFEWLKKNPKNSVRFIHNLNSDNPSVCVLNSKDI